MDERLTHGDNFDLVYSAMGWHGDDVPVLMMAMILLGLINENERQGDDYGNKSSSEL